MGRTLRRLFVRPRLEHTVGEVVLAGHPSDGDVAEQPLHARRYRQRDKAAIGLPSAREVVENHKFCRKLTIGFGDAPLGCLVAMRSWTMDDQFEHSVQRSDG